MQAILFIAGAIIMAVLDFVWIGNLFAGFYKREIGDMGRIVAGEFKPHPVGMIVYFLMSFAVIFFVLPKIGAGEWGKALVYGALFGLVIGGVYDLTNYSILARWSPRTVFFDMAWVIVSGSLSTLAIYLIREYAGK